MARFLTTRIITALITILGVATIVFVMMRLIPGGIVEALAGPAVVQSPEQVARIKAEHGLDKPLIVQYGLWLGNAVQGDFGVSLGAQTPVLPEIIRRTGLTVELAVLATIVSVVVGVPAGMIAAMRGNTGVDTAVRVIALIGLSVPEFVLGTLLIYFVSTRDLGLPISGYIPIREDVIGHVKSMILPTVSLGIVITAVVMRVTRASVAEVLSEQYVMAARAKGLHPRIVAWRHVMRAAMIPTVTIIGINMGYLLSGAVIIEQIFSLPGLGRYALEGILGRDYPVAQGTVVVGALMFILANLIVDATYAFLDPRIKY